MTCETFPPLSASTAAYPALLIGATRCWRMAKDDGQPIQPHLASLLSSQGCTMLAPVLDSLMRCYEGALGRPLTIGADQQVSDDEMLLLDLLNGSKPRPACFECPEQAAATLDCALCSLRIMMALETRLQ
ncbi:MAG: hypothetical protein AB7E05_11660 [Sphingobium sp.]